nr:GntR family transcriptional regulator [Pollutimonas harenae]
MSGDISVTTRSTPFTRENITTLIYRRLKNALMTGGYKPGDVMLLRIISEELGVSQTPVREALLQLVSERALNMERGKSITVPIFDKKRLQDLRAIRLKLEVMAAEYAVKNITDADIDELAAIHNRMMQCKLNEEREGTLLHNFEFHSTLYAASQMPDLIAIIEGLWAQTGPSLTYLYRPPFAHSQGDHPHLLVIAALKNRHTEGVVAAIMDDVNQYGLALMQRLPEEMT